MRILDVDQGTEEWLAARLGVPSASMFSKLITPTGKRAASFDGYVNQCVAEIVTGQATPFPQTDAMARGTELEPMARAFYELETGSEVVEMGFIKHETLEAGCSPDGFVGEDGGIEIKCPLPHTHVETLRGGVMPSKHIPQVQGCMWITGRAWWDFVSHHPDMHTLIVRIERDEAFIKTLEELVTEACETIQLLAKDIKA